MELIKKTNRYPGSIPFTLEFKGLFFGRDDDIDSLITFINVEKLSVLYGKSGLGKSSILNAGVMPKLEEKHKYIIIPVRFHSHVEGIESSPIDIFEHKIAEYSETDNFINKIESDEISSWQHIKNIQASHPDKSAILLVFDQFEELFTYPSGIDGFAQSLAELIHNRMPPRFRQALRIKAQYHPELLTDEQWEFLERPYELKILLSIRSDKMDLLNRMANHLPNILRNCYELKSLTRQQAQLAITEPGKKEGEYNSDCFTYQPEALDEILNYLTQNDQKDIESFQLQILCYHVEENIVIKQNDTYIEMADLGDFEEIYENYYDFTIRKTGTKEDQRLSRVFIEEGLIFAEEERRISLYEGQITSQYFISAELLQRLIDSHLIRAEPYMGGGYSYELSHDTLVAPIIKAKARRMIQEQWRKSRAKRHRPHICVCLLILIIIAFIDARFIEGEPIIPSVLFAASMFYILHEAITGKSLISRWYKRGEEAVPID